MSSTAMKGSDLAGDSPVATVVGHDSDDCLNKFRNLCLLVTLITAINDPHSYSMLALPGAATMSSLNKDSSVLHTMASILVLDHKVLACISKCPKDSESPNIIILQEDHSCVTVDGDKYENNVPAGPMKVATIANLEQGDTFQAMHDSCVSVVTGTSQWKLIHESDTIGWQFLEE
jgi:hypothetical protein